jgi:hypothetical protein
MLSNTFISPLIYIVVIVVLKGECLILKQHQNITNRDVISLKLLESTREYLVLNYMEA